MLFLADEGHRLGPIATPGAFRLWRTSITIGDLQATVARYLGSERAERSFAEYASALRQGQDGQLRLDAEADIQFLRFTERLLTSAIGAASARLVLGLLLRRSNIGNQSALRLLDDASEALQYNRDLLQSAIDQVRHGLGVFDADMRLICWNRQFGELLDLPTEMVRIGVPMVVVLKHCADRGDFGRGDPARLVAERMGRLSIGRETLVERPSGGRRILEVRTAAMPQGGIVATYSDITDRVAAASALAAANESLEQRVAARTAELTDVNAKLAVAKARADEANLDKTRFLAAASHDLLQPLSAARLYAASLVERTNRPLEAQLARNIDASLGSVEDILSALIDLSRMDAGALEPEFTAVSLAELLQQMQMEFAPLAEAKGLQLHVVASSAWVHADRRLLRRLLQNLVSNAVKYTKSGTVLIGVRRQAGMATIQVVDTGPGIHPSKHGVIFKEFQRLQENTHLVPGLGLGLSIVERIARVTGASIGLRSAPGRGATFWATMPTVAPRVESQGDGAVRPPAGSVAGLVTLCIDNEPSVLNGMRTLLEGWGCVVETAACSITAIAALEARGIVPDIVLADYQLDRETGLDAIAALVRSTGVQIPGVVITANHSPDVQRQVRAAGFALLQKPVKAAVLRALLSQAQLRRLAAAE
jgi:signal transduction histidine kinase/CheY-like chemotaxis protein